MDLNQHSKQRYGSGTQLDKRCNILKQVITDNNWQYYYSNENDNTDTGCSGGNCGAMGRLR